ncbi:nucleotidyltransferase family protein [Leptospira sp. 201903071]|uniref:nucleotidyltransferase family protein n=1 Tax=Leptospira ainazelensis TaxID=2810034 RepID=UPI0019655EB7|nr:nucleotidyltransferase family protein [Leptospira ainazelensis]MBM9501091.1 nucleotidyltransferase family protein [Leptospira ainazelensis]
MKNFSRDTIIKQLSTNMEKIRSFGVIHIGLFGSYAKDENQEESDVDILVEFAPNMKSFANYMGLKILLEDLFEKKIDLVIKEKIKPRIKEQILEETIYAA